MRRMTGLILFGESVVAGRGVKDRSFSFARIIKSQLTIPVLIKGKSFITSQEALNRLDKEVLQKDKIYSHVLILVGNNDPRLAGLNKPKFTVSEFKKNMEELIVRIKNDNRDVIICNLQPLSDEDIYRIHPAMPKFLTLPIAPHQWHEQYSDACREIASQCAVDFIDIRTELKKAKNNGIEVIADYCLDPNAKGHKIIADTVLRSFETQGLLKP